MEDLLKFLKSQPFIDYSEKNPESGKEIADFLHKFINEKMNLRGINDLYKMLYDSVKSEKSPPLKWFNIFSQVRCTSYLIDQGIKLTAVEVIKDDKVLDFKIDDGRFGEIKSFSTIDERLTDPSSVDDYVISTFVEKKVKPAFDKQKTDLLVIDDIFAYFSDQYGLLDYFLSFINRPDIKDRHDLIKEKLGPYLSRVLYLSFIKNISTQPTKKFVGEEFIKLGI